MKSKRTRVNMDSFAKKVILAIFIQTIIFLASNEPDSVQLNFDDFWKQAKIEGKV